MSTPILPIGSLPIPGPFPNLPFGPKFPQPLPPTEWIASNRISDKINELLRKLQQRLPYNPKLKKMKDSLEKLSKNFAKIAENLVEKFFEIVAPDLVFQYILSIPFLIKSSGGYKDGKLDVDTYNMLTFKASNLMALGGLLSALTGSDMGEELIESVIEPIIEEAFKAPFTAFQKIYVGGQIPEDNTISDMVGTGNINDARILGLLGAMTGLDNIMAITWLYQTYVEGNWSYWSSTEGNINWIMQSAVNYRLKALDLLFNVITRILNELIDMLVNYFDYWVVYDQILTQLLNKIGRLVETLIVTNNDTTINNVYAQYLLLNKRLSYIEDKLSQLSLPQELETKFNNMLQTLSTYLEKYYELVTQDFAEVCNVMIDALNGVLDSTLELFASVYDNIKVLRQSGK